MQQSYQVNEINLRTIFNSLLERKFLIIGLTGFITILAFLFTKTLEPTYNATSSFTSTSASSVININKKNYEAETKASIFASFLNQLLSKDFQKEVFIENDFLTKFNKDKKPIDDVNSFIEEKINSIKFNEPKLKGEDFEPYFINKSYEISMQGPNTEAILDYLDTLIAQADSKNIAEISKLNQQIISIRLDQISFESKVLLEQGRKARFLQIQRIKEEDDQKIRQINDQIARARYRAKEIRLNQIVSLIEATKLAKSLGIIENNFKLINDDRVSSDLTIAIGESKDLPEWYLYGEKALTQTVEMLKNRMSDDPFIPELVDLNNQLNEAQNNNALISLETRKDDSPFIPELIKLDIEKDKLKLIELNLAGSKSIGEVETAKLIIFSKNKILIVMLAFIGSFMMSVFLVLIMGALKPDEKAPIA